MLGYTILAGLLFGLYFSLVGLGLNLVFGVVRIVNLAHGDFLMLGAFSAYWLFSLFAVSPFISVVLVFVGFSIIAWPLYYLLVPRLMATKDPEMLSLILFFGFSQVIEALATIAFGTSDRSIPGWALHMGPCRLFGQNYPASWIVGAVVSAAAVLFIYLYLYHTTKGYLSRAVMAHREEAVASGINVNRVCAIAFSIGVGLAAAAGVFAPFIFGSINPAMGVNITITSLTVIVVGSLGNPLGTVLGGLTYGISLMFMQTYFSSWANLLAYVMLILILLIRPSGLLGRSVRYA